MLHVTTDLYKHLMCVYGFGPFGVNPNSNDYKVLRVSFLKRDHGYIIQLQFEVYKLGSLSWDQS